MKLTGIDHILLYSSDLDTSEAFYKDIGFKTKRNNDFIEAKLGRSKLVLFDQSKVHFKKEVKIEPKGAGVFIMINVDDVNDYHKSITSKGLSPSSDPKDWPWGNREFVIKDPDGYKLVFFEEI